MQEYQAARIDVPSCNPILAEWFNLRELVVYVDRVRMRFILLDGLSSSAQSRFCIRVHRRSTCLPP